MCIRCVTGSKNSARILKGSYTRASVCNVFVLLFCTGKSSVIRLAGQTGPLAMLINFYVWCILMP